MTTRRRLLAAAAGVAGAAFAPAVIGAARPRVAVVGAGFGGATCARYLNAYDPDLHVTLIDPATTYVTCPMSNRVVAGQLPPEAITFPLDHVANEHVAARAVAVDPGRRLVITGERVVPFDRAVLAPGIELVYDAIDGAPGGFLHAWRGDAQAVALRDAIRGMRPGGVFAIAVPDNPYRCPPGPYERASLAAEYFRKRNPRAKVLILDAKDAFTKQPLFEEAWRARYPGMIEWVPRRDSGTVVAVRDGAFITDFDEHAVDVGNLVPPQRAADIVRDFDAGRGWCSVDPMTFESTVAAGVHIVGDAIEATPMPKSAFAANNQAKACAAAVVALLRDRPPPAPFMMNTCYSLAASDYGFSVSGVYDVAEGAIRTRTAGQSPLGAEPGVREQEARHAGDWYRAITRDAFGVGDPKRGRRVVFERERGDCAICHELPGLDASSHGNVGPSLTDVGARLDARTIRRRIVDPHADNPGSVMPAYGRSSGLHRVAEGFRDRSVLGRADIDDATAYLLGLKGNG